MQINKFKNYSDVHEQLKHWHNDTTDNPFTKALTKLVGLKIALKHVIQASLITK